LTGKPELHRRCFAIDGGEGGALLSDLESSRSIKRVYSPRHADTLLVFGPLSQKLVPAARQLARAVPRPASALVVGDAAELLLGLRSLEPREVQLALAGELPGLSVADGSEPEPTEVVLPDRKELEIATEIAVHSLGPVQPFTDGPGGRGCVVGTRRSQSCQ
jgi:Ni,Fe-hydrogenase III small subunit